MATTVVTTLAASAMTADVPFNRLFDLSVASVVLLIALLVVKQVANVSDDPQVQRLAGLVDIGIFPLAFAVVVVIAARVAFIL